MTESYKELMVKKEKGMKEALMRAACATFTVIIGLLTILTVNFLLFIVTVALGVLTYFVFQWTDIEYEYLYLDKEITVDKVMAKSRRKRAVVLEVGKIEIMAPENSSQLEYYKNRQVKTTDLSAGHDLPGQKLYVVYYEGSQRFLLNLDDDFVNTIRLVAPRHVYME